MKLHSFADQVSFSFSPTVVKAGLTDISKINSDLSLQVLIKSVAQRGDPCYQGGTTAAPAQVLSCASDACDPSFIRVPNRKNMCMVRHSEKKPTCSTGKENCQNSATRLLASGAGGVPL